MTDTPASRRAMRGRLIREPELVAEIPGSNVLHPRYRPAWRTIELVTTVDPGKKMDSIVTVDMVHAHRTYCIYMLERVLWRTVTPTNWTEETDIMTILPGDCQITGTGQIETFDPSPGPRSRPLVIGGIWRSKRHAITLIGKQPLIPDRSDIDRMAIIVRYSGYPDNDLNVDAERAYKISEGLIQAFPETQLPAQGRNIMIRAENTAGRLIPSLWYDEEIEIRASMHDFVFGDYANEHWVNDEESAYSRAAIFTEHICAYYKVCRKLNLNGSFLIVGVDAMGCHWPRLMTFIQNLFLSTQYFVVFFIQIKDEHGKLAKLCPRVVGRNRFGRLESYDLMMYAFGIRERLTQDVIQAIAEWENVLGEMLEAQTANRRRDILARAERRSLH